MGPNIVQSFHQSSMVKFDSDTKSHIETIEQKHEEIHFQFKSFIEQIKPSVGQPQNQEILQQFTVKHEKHQQMSTEWLTDQKLRITALYLKG